MPFSREFRSPSQGKSMQAVVEAKSIIFAVQRSPTEKMGAYIRRAGAFFGLTSSQAKKIVYGEVKDLRASRLDAMRAKLDELNESASKRREILNEIEERRAAIRAGDRSGGTAEGGAGNDACGQRGDGASTRRLGADTEADAAARRAG